MALCVALGLRIPLPLDCFRVQPLVWVKSVVSNTIKKCPKACRLALRCVPVCECASFLGIWVLSVGPRVAGDVGDVSDLGRGAVRAQVPRGSAARGSP